MAFRSLSTTIGWLFYDEEDDQPFRDLDVFSLFIFKDACTAGLIHRSETFWLEKREECDIPFNLITVP